MSHSEVGPSRRRRPYVARACNGCRRRRCKCDGVQPVCGPCSSTGHECAWGVDGEDTGRPATKQFVESLRVKIQQLESEIAQLKQEQHQGQSPRTIPSRPSSIPTESSPLLTESHRSFGSTPPVAVFRHALPDTQPKLRPQLHLHAHAEPARPLHYSQPVPVEVPMINYSSTTPVLRYQYIFNIDANLPLDEQYPVHRASIVCQWNRYLPDLSPVQFSRFEHDTILSRYFSYGACCSFGIIPDLFLAQLLEYLTPQTVHPNTAERHRYYTPLLHCSLLAFGAGFSDNPAIRAPEVREKFATCAKEHLDDEFNNPSSSLMVSLALLSEYHSGIGERNTGYMYMGMAMRAARVRPGLTDPLIRDWHHWSVFIQGE
ncbi:hypothetical protein RSOLAG1IB_09643 [Rhizoctonia solani AG-1 IB]|uniref:Zn(2)-C6 fungal-type domain-containing protein n=1 Tax=Thanatephorus cucumeris (strain AG1-IB / isolate 7/3/14) TaxID=1108050 RepID=A0A0B7FW66_THACB|nr:hypothetical protein RSOLAG1IB_09643 [Rhizoctonia solani AG-1 IB]